MPTPSTPPATDPLADAPEEPTKSALLKAGDRITYLNITKFQMGSERQLEQGTVVDTVDGAAGKLQIVYSEIDDAMLRGAELQVHQYFPEGGRNTIQRAESARPS